MAKYYLTFIILFAVFITKAQTPNQISDSTKTVSDTIQKKELLKQLGNGYFPIKYFNLDLRYLIKYNQYEGLRTGIGGITNDAFSEKLKLNSYLVYGFRDENFKYSFGAGYRIAKHTNTWLSMSYTDDLQETGSTQFLTDDRIFQFFEPRLLNIELFHKHITKTLSLEHEFSGNLISEFQLAHSDIDPTYNYNFLINNKVYHTFHLSTLKAGFQWRPSNSNLSSPTKKNANDRFPIVTLQYTQSFKGLIDGDFNFSKFDFKTFHKIDYQNDSNSQFTLTAGLAKGKTPLTHLYHAYPNNNTKETILKRFSVAGINSFETMYFNEFFSDRFITFQFKHALAPFKISKKFNPQLVLITRYAMGDMNNIERHQHVNFKTLDKGYTESGLEINKLFFGFGLSFSYRYGAYHLPKIENNMALKFTFNVTL